MKAANNTCSLCGSNDTFLYLKANGFSVFKCNHCTNAWTNPFPGTINYDQEDFHQNEIADKSAAVKKITDLPKPWQNSLRQQVSLIRKHLPKGASILEIGCGEGILLRELKNAGFSVCGIEPSLTAAERAAKEGLNVIQGYFPHIGIAGKQFDLIIMSHVLEHLERPLDILNTIKDHLRPTGRLLLIQTCYEGVLPKLLKGKWYAWVPDQHFWHFTPNGIVSMTKSLGFHEVEREFSSLVYYNKGKFTLSNLVFFVAERLSSIFPDNFKDQFHLVLTLAKSESLRQQERQNGL